VNWLLAGWLAGWLVELVFYVKDTGNIIFIYFKVQNFKCLELLDERGG
jgi:hypothetical protein